MNSYNVTAKKGGSGRREFLAGSASLLAYMAAAKSGLAQEAAEPSGAYYDWQKTMQPEKPWLHDYSQTFVTGIFLCQRDGQGQVKKVYHTFEDALDVIRKMDNLTLGIPKVVVIVGWQFNGHDSGYPSWSVVNERLQRPQDKTALDSLKWLMAAARQYHTIVTLHINMFDAYVDSPLWKVYDENNIIIKDAQGTPIKGPHYDGMQSYQISYAQEWKLGYAQRRIDGLLQMLPELKEAGIIHIDAFKSIQGVRPTDPVSSPYLGFTVEDELAAQRRILRYWRSKGIDVSTEYAANTIDPDPFVGLQTGPNCIDWSAMLQYDWYRKPANFLGFPPRLFTAPPCDNEEPPGDSAEIHFDFFVKTFCRQVLPWYYRNNPAPKEDGFAFLPDYFGDIFLPALWRPGTILAYSPEGNLDIATWPQKTLKPRIWRLPRSWHHLPGVKLSGITTGGLRPLNDIPVKDGTVQFLLKAGDYVAVERT